MGLSLHYSLLDHLKCLQLTSNMFGGEMITENKLHRHVGPITMRGSNSVFNLHNFFRMSSIKTMLSILCGLSLKYWENFPTKNGLKKRFYWKHAYFLCINNSWLHLIFIILICYFDPPLHFSIFNTLPYHKTFLM